MKAVRIHERGGVEQLRVDEVEIPVAGQGEVLIKTAAAGLNFADIGQRTGRYPNLLPLPLTLGFEVAGVVVGLGEGVSGPVVGTRVVALVSGGYAEYAVARVEQVVEMPDEVSFEQAVVVPVQGQTAYLTLTRAARLQRGERVLVHVAAGGVGSLAVQVAKLLGAGQVIGTTTSPEKVELIRDLGVDLVVNTREENWVEQVMRATQGQGVDVVLDSIGGEVAMKSIMSLAAFGRYVNYGSLTGQPTPIVPQMLIGKCLSVVGYNTNIQPVEEQRRASEALLGYIAEGKLRVVLEHGYPLREAGEAQKALEEGRTRGKVVLTV